MGNVDSLSKTVVLKPGCTMELPGEFKKLDN